MERPIAGWNIIEEGKNIYESRYDYYDALENYIDYLENQNKELIEKNQRLIAFIGYVADFEDHMNANRIVNGAKDLIRNNK